MRHRSGPDIRSIHGNPRAVVVSTDPGWQAPMPAFRSGVSERPIVRQGSLHHGPASQVQPSSVGLPSTALRCDGRDTAGAEQSAAPPSDRRGTGPTQLALALASKPAGRKASRWRGPLSRLRPPGEGRFPARCAAAAPARVRRFDQPVDVPQDQAGAARSQSLRSRRCGCTAATDSPSHGRAPASVHVGQARWRRWPAAGRDRRAHSSDEVL